MTTGTNHEASLDGWTPALMEQLVGLRSRYARAYDRLWRDERLLRYVHWLRVQSHPDFNFIGSWLDVDIKAEIELWSHAEQQGLDEEDVIETVRSKLEEHFGFDLTFATTLATDLGLASMGLPIWNELTASLLPHSLGRLKIVSAANYETRTAGRGVGYSYRPADGSARADLYIYSGGERDLGNGTRDPRVLARFAGEWNYLQSHFQPSQAKAPMLKGPMVVNVCDLMDREFDFLSVLFSAPTETDDVMSSLSITAFCNAFLKIRFTSPAIDLEAESVPDTLRELIEPFNSDVAGFCCHFSRRGR